jgi:hypothetical protein
MGTPLPDYPLAQKSNADRVGFYTLLLGAFALLLVLALPLLLGRVYAACDLGWLTMPFKYYYARCLAAGDDFTWCPNVHCGYYLHGEGQIAMYHPLNLLLYSVLPWRVAYGVELLIHYPFLLAGTYVLLRRWSLSRCAALFGAVTFTLGGFNLIHFLHLMVLEVAAHIPWLLAAIDYLVRGTCWRRRSLCWFAVVLLTSSEILFGYQQCVYFSLFAEAVYVVFLFLRWPAPTRAALIPIILANVLGLAGGAVQLIPTWESFGSSYRSNSSASFANSFSLHPYNVIQLVSPYFFRGRFYAAGDQAGNLPEMGLYNGSVTTVLLFWLILRLPRLSVHRSLAIGLFVVLAVTLVLAGGNYGPLYKLQTMLPLVGRFRAPCRYILLVHLAMAGLAAIALQDVLRTGETTKREPRAIWCLLVVPLVLCSAPLWIKDGRTGSTGALLFGAALVAAALLVTAGVARGRTRLLPLLLLFAVADQGFYGIQYLWSSGVPTFEDYLAGIPEAPAPTQGRVCVGCTSTHVFRDLRAVDGWVGMWPRKVLDYRSEDGLRTAGVEWLCPEDAAMNPGYVTPADWRRCADPVPRVRLVARTVCRRGGQGEPPGQGLKDSAVVGEPLQLTDGPPGIVRSVCERPGRIEVETSADDARLLVITESMHPGWHVRVDGVEERVLAVDGDFMGCVVPGGTHRVELRFRPASLSLGAAVSCVGLGMAVVCLLASLVVGRRRSRDQLRPPLPAQGE